MGVDIRSETSVGVDKAGFRVCPEVKLDRQLSQNKLPKVVVAVNEGLNGPRAAVP